MENPSTSECAATDGSDDDRDLLRNGIRLDVERKHQQLREGSSAREPAQACEFASKALLWSFRLQPHDSLVERGREGADLHS